MIKFKQSGDFSKTINYLSNAIKTIQFSDLDTFGIEGVRLLSENTPKDSGLTANSWDYKIEKTKGKTTLSWYNSNVENGVPIAIILQYGHGTQNGGYIVGRDYINPAIRPLFDKIADNAWSEVTKI